MKGNLQQELLLKLPNLQQQKSPLFYRNKPEEVKEALRHQSYYSCSTAIDSVSTIHATYVEEEDYHGSCRVNVLHGW